VIIWSFDKIIDPISELAKMSPPKNACSRRELGSAIKITQAGAKNIAKRNRFEVLGLGNKPGQLDTVRRDIKMQANPR